MLGALLYVFSTCGFGQFVSTFRQTQVAAVFATTILAVIPTVNFSGLLVPVSSLTGQGRRRLPPLCLACSYRWCARSWRLAFVLTTWKE